MFFFYFLAAGNHAHAHTDVVFVVTPTIRVLYRWSTHKLTLVGWFVHFGLLLSLMMNQTEKKSDHLRWKSSRNINWTYSKYQKVNKNTHLKVKHTLIPKRVCCAFFLAFLLASLRVRFSTKTQRARARIIRLLYLGVQLINMATDTRHSLPMNDLLLLLLLLLFYL